MRFSKIQLILFALIGAPLAAAPAVKRPNVLFIAIDDLRINLGCYGDQYARTPNLDSLAGRGTLFSRAYCQQAVCNPSRQSLLSGRTPDSIRVWDLATLFRQTTPDVVPLPEYFKRNGYFAQSFGKIYHGFPGMNDPQSWSVPEQYEYVAKRDDYRLVEASDNPENENFKAAAIEFADAPDDAYPDGKVAAGAVAALNQFARDPKHQPFFLAVGFRKPHLPFTGPKRFWDMYDTAVVPALTHADPPKNVPALALHNSPELRGYSDMPKDGPFTPEEITRLRRGYYAATSWADSQVGRVLKALEETGFAQDTIVIVWGDNGWHLGELGMWAKDTNYECATRVPLMVVTPDSRARGVRTNAIVELLDIYPSLLELCGLPQDPKLKLEGRSFVAELGDEKHDGRSYAVSQFPRPWKGNGKGKEYMGYTVRTPTHRYVEWRRFGTNEVVARELYAYKGDEMFESENLAADPAQRALCDKLATLLPSSPPAKSERDAENPRQARRAKGASSPSQTQPSK